VAHKTHRTLHHRAAERTAVLAHDLERLRAAAALIVDPANQTYLTGFRALMYTRPILVLVTADGTAIVVPGLEEAHARADAAADEILVYHEHPRSSATWTDCLDELLRRLPAGATIGVEFGVCTTGLTQHLGDRGHRVVDLDPVLARMRAYKDEVEIAVIREAACIAAAGVAASLHACRVGTTEIEVDAAGSAAVMAAVARFDSPMTVEQLIMTPSGPERSTLPHVLSSTRRLAAGDGLIHTRQVGLDGYRAELERSAFVSRLNGDQRRVFDVMRLAQERAVDALRAGVRCCDVDRAARDVIDDAGLGAFAIHRTGHGIGLSPHEPPYVRHDADAVLDEGMVVTIEPGIYVPGLGGFRHSDTLLVRHDDAELLTHHPANVDELTFGDR
jgi:Xaa-Pro dipeptidase